jgi:hypothetical protein
MSDFCKVSETNEGFEFWASVNSLSDSTRERIQQAGIVVVPDLGFRDHEGPVFPVETTVFFQFLQAEAPPEVRVEIAAEDSAYAELALHADILTIATFVVKDLLLPVVLPLVSTYIWNRIGNTAFPTKVRASLIIEQGSGESRRLLKVDYKGPATTFEKTVSDSVRLIGGGDTSAAVEASSAKLLTEAVEPAVVPEDTHS